MIGHRASQRYGKARDRCSVLFAMNQGLNTRFKGGHWRSEGASAIAESKSIHNLDPP